MKNLKLSQANQAYINNVNQNNTEITQPIIPEEKKNGKKLIVAGFAGLGILGLAAVMVFKGKSKQANEIASSALKDIKFDKGIAKKGDELFSGIIKDTVKGKDGIKKITLEYKNGIIQKATKDGVEKTFDHKASKKLADVAKEQNDKLKKIIKENKDVSLEDFTKQTDEIKFKSDADKKAIEDIKAQKQKAIDDAKAEAEKAAKEAQERAAKEAQERAAKEAEEKAAKEAQEKAATKEDIFKQKNLETTVKANNIYAKELLDNNPDLIKKIDNTLLDPELAKELKLKEGATISDLISAKITKYDGEIPEVYHGTSKLSGEKILKDGFNLDYVQKAENGTGVYFALNKEGAEKYIKEGGMLITGKTPKDLNIAQVNTGGMGLAGIIENCAQHTRMSLMNTLNLDLLECEKLDAVINEYVARKIKSMGYDAVAASTFNAKCSYLCVFDPSKLKLS